MGNTLAPMQKKLGAATGAPQKDAKEMLDRLEDMAQDRIDIFYETVARYAMSIFRTVPG
jgi:hypothetical protein